MRPTLLLGAAGALAAGAYAAPSLARALPPCLVPKLCGIGPDPGHVALTFDDGPDPVATPVILRALDRLGWRATFFCLGSMVAASPGLVEEIVGAGHEIGVHGYTHEGALRRTPGALTADVGRTSELLERATGVAPHWYRPPYGELSAGTFLTTRKTGLRLVLWERVGCDWRAEATPASVVADLAKGVLAGGTMLLHDSDCTSTPSSWRMTAAALPLLAEHLHAQGLRVGTLGEHGLAA